MRWHPPLGVSRAIVADMASSTGAATSAGNPVPSTSSASPLSTLAQSTIAARDTEAKEGNVIDEPSGIPSAPEEEDPTPPPSPSPRLDGNSVASSSSSSSPVSARRARGVVPALLSSISEEDPPISASTVRISRSSDSPGRSPLTPPPPPASRTNAGSNRVRPHPRHTTHTYSTYDNTSAEDSCHDTVFELMATNAKTNINAYATTSLTYGNGSTDTPCCEWATCSVLGSCGPSRS